MHDRSWETLQIATLAIAFLGRYHPIDSFPTGCVFSPASPVPNSKGAALQFGEQLESLSQVCELITIRLLELEERLGKLELSLNQRQHKQEYETGDGEVLLATTAERITRLEELLTGGPSSLEQPHFEHPQLQIVPESPQTGEQEQEQTDTGFDEPEMEMQSFPNDNEEQSFMDEMSA